MIFETLNKLINNERKQPMHIYLDESDGKIKKRPLKLDSAASAIPLISNENPVKLIHKFMFGY